MPLDIKFTADGDLVINSAGDIELVDGDDQIAQEVLFRLKTTPGDWTLSPRVGAGLERFIGQPNTDLTRAAIEQAVESALTYDQLVPAPTVDCIPVDANTVLVLVEFDSVENDRRMVQVRSSLDLKKGKVFSRVGFREI